MCVSHSEIVFCWVCLAGMGVALGGGEVTMEVMCGDGHTLMVRMWYTH